MEINTSYIVAVYTDKVGQVFHKEQWAPVSCSDTSTLEFLEKLTNVYQNAVNNNHIYDFVIRCVDVAVNIPGV